MESILIEGLRCFGTRVEVPLRPLTILVGENSTGKSTFLGAIRLAWDLAAGDKPVNFKEPPFDFGHFQNFRHAAGSGGPATTVTLGFTARNDGPFGSAKTKQRPLFSFSTTLGETDGAVMPESYALEISGKRFRATRTAKRNTLLEYMGRGGNVESQEIDWPLGYAGPNGIQVLSMLDFRVAETGKRGGVKSALGGRVPTLELSSSLQLQGRPYATAPIRSRPQRTYDPVQPIPEPEGGHVPVVLAQLVAGNGAAKRRALELLQDYGRASGLFSSIEIRRLGDKDDPGDPFQIQIGVPGQRGLKNLVDIGYGVSQVLPLLVDLATERSRTFLLQQPEVHLHPKAQAEIGSLLLRQAARGDRQFIVETHSDYIVDRICMEVREGLAKPGDVSILYFERDSSGVNIHQIGIDEGGNIVNAPSGYRKFFEQETDRLLGLKAEA